MADYNYRSYADCSDVLIDGERIKPDNCLDYDDVLKFSNVKYAVVTKSDVWGGKEDCIDMNRNCSDICINDSYLFPRGKYGMTIKGGTKNVTLRNVTFLGHGKEADIDIGNWSDQSQEKTTNIKLIDVIASDGKPVRVRVLWGDPPEVVGGNVKIVIVSPVLVKIYRFLRKHRLVP
jgi:hypothetical protein